MTRYIRARERLKDLDSFAFELDPELAVRIYGIVERFCSEISSIYNSDEISRNRQGRMFVDMMNDVEEYKFRHTLRLREKASQAPANP